MNKIILFVIAFPIWGWNNGAYAQPTFQKMYGEPGDACFSMAQTDAGYIMAGTTCNFGAGSFDAYVIETDPLGDTIGYLQLRVK